MGGSVYWGVRDNDHAVMGVILNASERDDLRKTVTSTLDKIQPALTPNAYHINLHQVVNSDSERVENTFVVELSVKAHENRSIYFAGGKHAYIKNDSGRKELSGLELVDEIKRRERIVSKNTVLWDISDYLHLLKEIKPILFWIDKEINKNDAPVFFSALQVLFHGNYRFFEKVNDGLLFGVDNLLRVLGSLPKYDGYSENKFHTAAGNFTQYLDSVKLSRKDSENYRLKEVVRSINKKFRSNLANGLSETEEERLLIVLIIHLLDYLHDCVFKKRKMMIPEVSRRLTDSVFEFIIPLVESSLTVQFPAKNDDLCSMIIGDIQKYCEEDWLLFKKYLYR